MVLLSKVDLSRSLDKKTYKEHLEQLETKLAELQLAVRDAGIPVAVVFEGWGASGKGTIIARAVNQLDPRYFKVHTMDKIHDDMAMRPFLWPFWNMIPAKGRFVFIDKGWHRLILPGVKEKWALTESEENNFYSDVNAFERQLTDDGMLIVKFFLHISKGEQRDRFKALEENEDTAWRVRVSDWEQNKDYDKHLTHYEEMIRNTTSDENPWHIVEAEDIKYAVVKVFETLIRLIQQRLKDGSPPSPLKYNPHPIEPVLGKTVCSKDVSEKQYKQQLAGYQQRLNELGYRLYLKRRPVIICYEGWDAAGKGGNIKRLIEELDPRSYEVVPIAAPTAEEKAHHYLWRFYNNFPKDGHIAIFDRTWYGRVLVERVENLAEPDAWQRAYREINEMEAHLINHGAIILKFWLHIDQDEQLKRFHARQSDPLKQYKITYDDWRNRDNWALYEEAANEMIARTSSTSAPWTIIEANNKKYARLKVLQTVVEALEVALK